MRKTYTPCNLPVKSRLRPEAFFPYAPCRILPGMSDSRIYLREWRKKKGLTQDQVVARLELHEDPLLPRTNASLSRLENGKQPYSQRVLEALADVYGCEAWELIGRDPHLTQPEHAGIAGKIQERRSELAVVTIS